jgi:hypothetical protein
MKLAILSESPADELAIKVLIDGIRGEINELIAHEKVNLRSHGWPHTLKVLPGVLRFLHYQTEVESLAVVVDSDDEPLHERSHVPRQNPSCRLCKLRVTADSFRPSGPSTRAPIKVAIGLAVPAIEAWFQCGVDPRVNEAAWIRKQNFGESIGYDRMTLKKSIYNSTRILDTQKAVEAAENLVPRIDMLDKLFPGGFGTFSNDIRNW